MLGVWMEGARGEAVGMPWTGGGPIDSVHR